jgi:ABC-type Fe3+-siderophore transport system permease subunit
MKVFGRNPAAWLGLVAVGVQFLVAWGVPLTEPQQAGINAVATLVMGLVLAVTVAREQIIPVASALLVAVLQLAIAFGAHMGQHQVATAGALLTGALALWLHGQVTAPIAPDGSRVSRETPLTAP